MVTVNKKRPDGMACLSALYDGAMAASKGFGMGYHSHSPGSELHRWWIRGFRAWREGLVAEDRLRSWRGTK